MQIYISEALVSELPTNHCFLLFSQPRTLTMRATIVLGRNTKTTRIKQTMNNEMSPIKIDGDVERAWASLLEEQIDEAMLTAPPDKDG